MTAFLEGPPRDLTVPFVVANLDAYHPKAPVLLELVTSHVVFEPPPAAESDEDNATSTNDTQIDDSRLHTIIVVPPHLDPPGNGRHMEYITAKRRNGNFNRGLW